MNIEYIDRTLKSYVDNGEIAGAVLIVRKDGDAIYDNAFGYADIENKRPVDKHTMFRLASMTKPLIAVAIMQLVEQGRIGLYDEITQYFPEFAQMQVCAENLIHEGALMMPENAAFLQEKVRQMTYVPAKRVLTIFDLLTHSCGLGCGPVGQIFENQELGQCKTLRERVAYFAKMPLEFQPGEDSAYSGGAAFDILGAILEKISGMDLDAYLKIHVLKPLGIRDMGYHLSEEQVARIPKLYDYVDEKLKDVTVESQLWRSINPLVQDFCSGAAGMIGSMAEYDKFAQMLLDGGVYQGQRILKEETVRMMAGEGISHGSVMIPGTFWGLGMIVFEQPEKMGLAVEPGCFSWSGSFGTHFIIDPKNQMEFVLGVNRENIGGAASHVSRAVEKAVYEGRFDNGI